MKKGREEAEWAVEAGELASTCSNGVLPDNQPGCPDGGVKHTTSGCPTGEQAKAICGAAAQPPTRQRG